jgi:hypothetical protein
VVIDSDEAAPDWNEKLALADRFGPCGGGDDRARHGFLAGVM